MSHSNPSHENYDEPIDEYYEDEFSIRSLPQKLAPAIAWATGVFSTLMILAVIIFVGTVLAEEKPRFKEVTIPQTIEEEPPEEVIVEDPDKREIEEEEVVKEPVIITNVEESEVVETEDELDFEESLGEPNLNSFVNQHQTQRYDSLGIGGGGSGKYGTGKGGRRNRANRSGTSRVGLRSVWAALLWLKKHQSPDGHWGVYDYRKQVKNGEEIYADDPEGDASYDIGVTALAVLAYVGDGHTHIDGRFHEQVRMGLNWLYKQQNPKTGFFGEEDADKFGTDHPNAPAYNHMLATYALTDLLSMEPDDKKLRAAATKAVQAVLRWRNKGAAWRYRDYRSLAMDKESDGTAINDVSVTGWAVMALKGAKTADIEIPNEVFLEVGQWLDKLGTVKKNQFSYGYLLNGDTPLFVDRTVDTACGLLCRQFMGQKKNTREAADFLKSHLPKAKEGAVENMYYLYYGTLTMFQMQSQGNYWDVWSSALKKTLIPTQCNKGMGVKFGSWSPQSDKWGYFGGRVYSTAMGALSFETYYRYQLVEGKADTRLMAKVMK